MAASASWTRRQVRSSTAIPELSIKVTPDMSTRSRPGARRATSLSREHHGSGGGVVDVAAQKDGESAVFLLGLNGHKRPSFGREISLSTSYRRGEGEDRRRLEETPGKF
jgi:hypothetical protein